MTDAQRPTPGRRSSLIKRIGRALLSASITQWALAIVGAGYVWASFRTTRWTRIGVEHEAAALEAPALLVSVWHGRLAPIVMLRPRGRRSVGMISAARDGELIARIVRLLGGETVRGSSHDPKKPGVDKGGAAARAAMEAALEDGAVGVITPDGPRGPRMRAKPGIAALSAASGAPVLPVAFSVRRGRVLGSWDAFLLPYPFGRGALVYGEPIPAPSRSDPDALETHRRAVEEATTAAMMAADREVGRESPSPGPPLHERVDAAADAPTTESPS